MRLYFEDNTSGATHKVEIVPGLRIGRRGDFIIRDATVSRYHARIVRIFDDFYIIDNDSTNGVYVDGKRIEKMTELKLGRVIKIGRGEMKVAENEN